MLKKKCQILKLIQIKELKTFTDFDSLDDKIDCLYYYMQYIKFGFGRATRETVG